jgi:Domain of unknown function (DU1801)
MNPDSQETQIEGFVAKYSPEIAAALRDARARLRGHFPRGFELVFENYNALVFGMSPTERSLDAFVSIAGYPRWVTLFFLHGTELDDPAGLLAGTGKQVRSIRLVTPADLARPEVEALIAQAMRRHEAALGAGPPLTTVVKMVVASPRPRRPAAKSVAAPSSKRRGVRK